MTFDIKRLDEGIVKKMSTEKSFKEGTKYFKQGRVLAAKVNDLTVKATVAGGAMYDVILPFAPYDNNLPACTCFYNSWGICKHIVASLLYIRKNFESMQKIEEAVKVITGKILSGMTGAEMKELLRLLLESDSGLMWKFIGRYRIGEAVPYAVCSEEIDRMYVTAPREDGVIRRDANIDFEPIIGVANAHVKKKNFSEAESIYRRISDAINANAQDTDDSDGEQGDYLKDVIKLMVACINKQKLDGVETQKRISYLLQEYLDDRAGYADDFYYDALMDLRKNREDLEYLLKIIEPHIPRRLPSKNSIDRFKVDRTITIRDHAAKALQRHRKKSA